MSIRNSQMRPIMQEKQQKMRNFPRASERSSVQQMKQRYSEMAEEIQSKGTVSKKERHGKKQAYKKKEVPRNIKEEYDEDREENYPNDMERTHIVKDQLINYQH